MPLPYVGRFAPSPTGLLHLGSLACAMASYLDARAHQGQWLIRIEDIDPPRDIPGADQQILTQLKAFDLYSDAPVTWQHDHYERYEAAFEKLRLSGVIYPCTCTRKAIAATARSLGLASGVYPGTCRPSLGQIAPNRNDLPLGHYAWRFRVNDELITIKDRACGSFSQNLEKDVGDFVILRADGLWAYQLAVVVDDAASHITHVVRGADLLDNTPRQWALQRALNLPHPTYLHIPLVLGDDGKKLSKQNQATPVPLEQPLLTLESLWIHLGFPRIGADNLSAFWHIATECWAERWSVNK